LELSAILKNVTVVESIIDGKGKIDMGSKVKVLVNGKEKEYEIVSFNEADPLSGKISNESPLGMAFLGKKKGEEVIAETPKGEIKYKIIDFK
jgi:transcription elongation factor GreA